MAELFDRRGSKICISIDTLSGETWVEYEPWLHQHIVVQFRGESMILADLLQSLHPVEKYNTSNTIEGGSSHYRVH